MELQKQAANTTSAGHIYTFGKHAWTARLNAATASITINSTTATAFIPDMTLISS